MIAAGIVLTMLLIAIGCFVRGYCIEKKKLSLINKAYRQSENQMASSKINSGQYSSY